MFSKFSNSALETISVAIERAAGLGRSWVDAEHILLALTVSGKLSNVLETHGLVESKVRSEFE